MADIKYEIVEELAVLSRDKSGWQFELNRVSWNGGKPKFDLRRWSPDHEKMNKGVTFDEDEAVALSEALKGKK